MPGKYSRLHSQNGTMMRRMISVLALVSFSIWLSRFAGADERTGLTGGGQPYNNLQPSLATNYIVRTSDTSGELGEVMMFAGNFAPVGWAFADGQLLNKAANPDLFSHL